MPASSFSSRLKRKLAWRLVATSPAAALRFLFLAIGYEYDPAGARSTRPRARLDALHQHLDGVAQAQLAPRALGHQRGAQLVELPPAAQAPRRAAAPRSPRRRSARRRPSRSARPPRPRRRAAPPDRRRPGGARAGTRGRRRRRRARSASPRARRPRHCTPTSSSSCAGAAVVVDAEPLQQRAVGHHVRVAADRRGEVAVARAGEPGVAEVPGRVEGLLERAQHEDAVARSGRSG